MTNEILDQAPPEKKSIRPPLLNWAEIFLSLFYISFCLIAFFSRISSSGTFIPLLILLMLSNLKFIYSSRKAIINYEETQNTEKVSSIKKSTSRLAFICTAVCLCFISILFIGSFIITIGNTESTNIGPVMWNSYFAWQTFLALVILIIIPTLQVYYMVQTSHIFSLAIKD